MGKLKLGFPRHIVEALTQSVYKIAPKYLIIR